eukprot:CAMPEP_0119336144 /NCGR_PEP_ID=MMETSP1333-20130426/91229_1 /TAXON_ID=418940 /ORGANISM="Scyphosphaera apsteinii, Strain RCC1455" /LENGTH=114 /DNA_ID=CAMNT_0007346877 /DNA_START=28 /DNA_END=372 /DNA_ORIENTATION=+
MRVEGELQSRPQRVLPSVARWGDGLEQLCAPTQGAIYGRFVDIARHMWRAHRSSCNRLASTPPEWATGIAMPFTLLVVEVEGHPATDARSPPPLLALAAEVLPILQPAGTQVTP